MKDIMLDLETLGTRPGCAVMSIGAVAFDPYFAFERDDQLSDGLGESTYIVLDRMSCAEVGLFEESQTVTWWTLQSAEARTVFNQSSEHGFWIHDALWQFTQFLKTFDLREVRIWGNGSDFDNTILTACYEAINEFAPWKFWNNRCYRTLKSIKPRVELHRTGIHHHALDDAKFQAMHAIKLMNAIERP